VYANGAKLIESSPLHHPLLASLLLILTPAFVALFPIYGGSGDAGSPAERE